MVSLAKADGKEEDVNGEEEDEEEGGNNTIVVSSDSDSSEGEISDGSVQVK